MAIKDNFINPMFNSFETNKPILMGDTELMPIKTTTQLMQNAGAPIIEWMRFQISSENKYMGEDNLMLDSGVHLIRFYNE